MPTLRELQRAFAAGVWHTPQPEILQQILPGGFAPERHFQVYRNNVLESLTGALKAVYPVVERLVGQGFFRYAAASYIPQHPPASGNLHDFGAGFAEFLAAFPPARELPYLPDVAQLEWAVHECFHAADAEALALATLAQVEADRYDRLRFRLHPSARLLESEYPIQRIWEVNQPDHAGDATVSLDQGGAKLLVIRRPEVHIKTLTDGDFALLTGCARGLPFAATAAAALRAQADFDLTGALARHVRQGTLTGFELE